MTCPKCAVRLDRDGPLAWCRECGWEHPESGHLPAPKPEPRITQPGMTRHQIYYANHREAQLARLKDYYQRNREAIRERANARKRERYATDPAFRAAENQRKAEWRHREVLSGGTRE